MIKRGCRWDRHFHSAVVSERFRGNVFGFRIRFLRIHRGVECLQHDSALVCRQPGANHEAAVVINEIPLLFIS